MSNQTTLAQSNIYREIHEQPAALRRLLENSRGAAAELAQAIHTRAVTHVVIAARGTSDNAGRYAQYVLGAHNQLIVSLATPSLFTIYAQPPQFHNALVLGISQSGKSPDIVAVMDEAQRQGALTAVMTNAPDSPLAEQADHVIDIAAGPELAVAATKSYTNEVAAIALLSALLSEDEKRLEELDAMPQAVARTLAASEPIGQAAQRYCYMNRSVIIGRGFNYATAFELALKMKELTYTLVEPYSSADFLHGPVAMVEAGFPVITVAPSGVMQEKMQEFVAAAARRNAEILVISDDDALLSQARTPLPIAPGVAEWLSPITAIVPGQLFAMHLAHARGYNVDAPRGLRKVTETR
ncbi:MAG: SIS domain-containing protein [Caldilineaceae bacterium]|nr:SIS domain-containing protein [Caldilineaceae bacterium]